MNQIQMDILCRLRRDQWTDAIDLPGTGHSLVALERRKLVEYVDSYAHLSFLNIYTPRKFSHKYRLSEAGVKFLSRR